MADMKMELEHVEIEEKEEVNEIEQIKEKLKTGDLKLSEISGIISEINKRVEEKMQKINDIDRTIAGYRERISQLEKEKQRLREEIRDLNIVVSGIQDMIRSAMGFAVSKVSGKPINANTRGKGFRVYIRTTEAGVKAGLANVAGEFDSMAKAAYALGAIELGKRTDFKSKLESLAKHGLIELQFL